MCEHKVRLPGTAQPISILTAKQKSALEILNEITRQYQLQDPSERHLVISPTPDDPGKLLQENDVVTRNEDVTRTHVTM